MKPPIPLALLAALLPIGLCADPAPPAQPVIPERTFSLPDYGAVPDGHTPNTAAFARAIAAVAKAGGGTLDVPAGDYFTGPIELCSGLNLHLAAGARLLFSQNFDDYRIQGTSTGPWSGPRTAMTWRSRARAPSTARATPGG